jgi:serine/threonine protein kinase
VLSLASADALKAHELLTREARVLQRLDHPRIPKLVDFFSEEDGPQTREYLVQQHVDGKSLLELVRVGRRFDESERWHSASSSARPRVSPRLRAADPAS